MDSRSIFTLNLQEKKWGEEGQGLDFGLLALFCVLGNRYRMCPFDQYCEALLCARLGATFYGRGKTSHLPQLRLSPLTCPYFSIHSSLLSLDSGSIRRFIFLANSLQA